MTTYIIEIRNRPNKRTCSYYRNQLETYNYTTLVKSSHRDQAKKYTTASAAQEAHDMLTKRYPAFTFTITTTN